MAKKAQSTLLNMFLSLTVISVVAAATLALVNNVTMEPIAMTKKAQTEMAIKSVVPSFDSLVSDTIGDFVCNRAYDNSGKLVGMAINVYTDKGFSGRINMMIGFDAQGNIYGYKILQHAETPGLGAKADMWFQKDGKGSVIGKNPETSDIRVVKDGGEIDAISGSTITSRAFCDAVASAYDIFKQQLNK